MLLSMIATVAWFLWNPSGWKFEWEPIVVFLGLLGTYVVIDVKHTDKDKKESRIKDFINSYQNHYKGYGGNFLKPLIPSGINLLKNDDEIEESLNSLKLIYATHPLRDWDSEVKKIGYSKFFRHAVSRNINELRPDKMTILINELKK